MKHLKLFEAYNNELDLSNKKLTSIDKFEKGVLHIYCNNNNLTSLPDIPNGVTYIKCSNNLLSSLPKLPESLEYLWCSNNILKSLPEIPKNVVEIICYNNEIKYLPELHDGVKRIACYNNPLECIIPSNQAGQDISWLNGYYYPYINSYKGQKNILTRQPHMVKDLIKQAEEILPEIKKEFAHLFTGHDLNLLD